MFKRFLSTCFAALIAVAPGAAWSQTDIGFISPFQVGGSTLPFIKEFADQLQKKGVILDQRYLGNCRLAAKQLDQSTKKYLYVWSSDLKQECGTPHTVSPSSFVGTLFTTPMYVCGRLSSLDQYRGKKAVLGTNPGEVHTRLGEQLRDKISPEIRIINYANTGALKTAVVTGEIDLVLHSSGKALAKEKLVTCYAATTFDKVHGIDRVSDIVGPVANSEHNIAVWFAAANLTAQEMATVRETMVQWSQTQKFQSMVESISREQPVGSIDQQMRQVQKTLQ